MEQNIGDLKVGDADGLCPLQQIGIVT